MSDTTQPLRIAVTGASGLIGQRLISFLSSEGHRVQPLVRRDPAPGSHEIRWDPQNRQIDAKALSGADAVIHLAGENIAAGRWTAARKEKIRRSRVEGTRFLCEALTQLSSPPRVLLAASAVGYYGHRGNDPVDEQSAPGSGFLPRVCRQWEEATQSAQQAGIRVVNRRIGIVLAAEGGALAKMLTPFKAGMGGPVGSGKQYMSWIAIDDLVRCVEYIINRDDLVGPVNAVSPQPVTNASFASMLGRLLHRPTLVPLPSLAVKTLFGEMGRALLLEGARVLPTKLINDGFEFSYPDLESALRHEIDGSTSKCT
jgi:uncharacterized protein (TIGR01777 family)